MSQTISRRNLLKSTLAVPAIGMLSSGVLQAGEPADIRHLAGGVNGCHLMPGAEFYVAVDNKGLWPNLTKLPDGELAAAVFNHPSHGFGINSDVELWVSGDGGRNWRLRSRVSDHSENPNLVRMNHAVGLNAAGELVAVVSGYQEGRKLPLLAPQLCISADRGHTWERRLLDFDGVPYGDIFPLPDGRLVLSTYARASKEPQRWECSLLFSHDGGRNWGDKTHLADTNETHVVRLQDGIWLAAGRTICQDRMDDALPHGSGELLFRSEDEGKTWSSGKPISPQGQENAHLLELADGRLLCSFTSRIPGLFGVVLRISEDGGRKWSYPVVLISMPARDWHKTDCGYPSSVQLDDGAIVTAYYFGPRKPEWAAHGLPWHQRYHMGVARWDLSCWPVEAG